jgi:hypothetical protein
MSNLTKARWVVSPPAASGFYEELSVTSAIISKPPLNEPDESEPDAEAPRVSSRGEAG